MMNSFTCSFLFIVIKTMKKEIGYQKPTSFHLGPVYRFIGFSILFISALVLLTSLQSVQAFFIRFTAWSLHQLLSILSIQTELLETHSLVLLEGTQLRFVIVPDCTGTYPIAILAGFILAYPSKYVKKIKGILGAVISSFLINYLRMISLIAIGAYSQRAFELAHLLIWQSSFIIFIIGYFLWWVRWK